MSGAGQQAATLNAPVQIVFRYSGSPPPQLVASWDGRGWTHRPSSVDPLFHRISAPAPALGVFAAFGPDVPRQQLAGQVGALAVVAGLLIAAVGAAQLGYRRRAGAAPAGGAR